MAEILLIVVFLAVAVYGAWDTTRTRSRRCANDKESGR